MEVAQKRKSVASKKLTDPDNATEQELPSHRGVAQRSTAGRSSSISFAATTQALSQPPSRSQTKPFHSRPQIPTSQALGTKRSADVAFAEPVLVTAVESSDADGGKEMGQGTYHSYLYFVYCDQVTHFFAPTAPGPPKKRPLQPSMIEGEDEDCAGVRTVHERTSGMSDIVYLAL